MNTDAWIHDARSEGDLVDQRLNRRMVRSLDDNPTHTPEAHNRTP